MAAVSILHVSSVHPRGDVRIVYKMCGSAIGHGIAAALLVADGLGSGSVSGVPVYAVSKPSSRLHRFLITQFHIYLKVREINPKIVHFHDPELVFLGVWLKLIGYKVIYDVHEDLPRQILTKYWIPSVFRGVVSRLAGWIEVGLSRRLSAVVAATDVIALRFNDRNLPPVLVQNYPIISDFSFEFAQETLPLNPRSAVYVGSLSSQRGIVEIIDAVGRLEEAKLYLAGSWQTNSFRLKCEALPSWSKVVYLGILTPEEVGRLLNRCMVGLVTLWPTENYLESMPVKMFEYMAAGLPIIASDFPYWRQYVRDIGSGLMVNPLAPDEIANALELLFNDDVMRRLMGEVGERVTAKFLNWSPEYEKLHCLYCTLLSE